MEVMQLGGMSGWVAPAWIEVQTTGIEESSSFSSFARCRLQTCSLSSRFPTCLGEVDEKPGKNRISDLCTAR